MTTAVATAAILKGLKEAGWVQDPSTGSIRPGSAPIYLPNQGRSIIRSPEGILHEVFPGSIQPLDGRYHVMAGNGTWTAVRFADGREVPPR